MACPRSAWYSCEPGFGNWPLLLLVAALRLVDQLVELGLGDRLVTDDCDGVRRHGLLVAATANESEAGKRSKQDGDENGSFHRNSAWCSSFTLGCLARGAV